MAENKPENQTPEPKQTKPGQAEPAKKVVVKSFTIDMSPKNLMNKAILYILLGLLFLPFIVSLFTTDLDKEISMTTLVKDIRDEKIASVKVAGDELRVTYKDGAEKISLKEEGQDLVSILQAADIDLAATDLEVKSVSFGQLLWELLLSFLPVILMIGVFLFIFRGAKGGPDIMGIGKSKAKLFVKGKQNTKFADVGGMDEAKKELEEVVDFLKNPKKYKKVGARTPKGVLLVGPAGTGKTLLARAVAGEASVQFLSIAGSEFMEMLVGVGASRVRDLFTTAKKLAPAIIFIDEIDAIGRARGRGSMSGGHDEREQTLNQILVEMDGFSQNDNVIVMAATNRGDMLDSALIRPGRFDRRVMVNLPDLEERKFIIKIHAKGKPFVKGLDWDRVAKRTVGFSGADIENMLNEAAISIAREAREEITSEDIEEAALKVKLGPSKKRLQDELEKEMTAYHEIGHAIVAHVSPHADPVHRVSIISRGRALGFTLTPPEKDKLQTTKSELLDDIAVLLGGRSAEKQVFSELTAGASSDIQKATQIARAMVMDYGMSELGPMNFHPDIDQSYDSYFGDYTKLSERLQEKVDGEIQKFITEGQTRAEAILKKYAKQLKSLSEKLIEVESLDGDEFEKLMGVKKAKH
ncbi:MAG: ATP-dependent zinc metalloprotease FtsH [Patescibacteria group bacterium]|nr:MAG: ATP-dependent zinc metalloprotease FtsH [Patescibacteria group bacterium]